MRPVLTMFALAAILVVAVSVLASGHRGAAAQEVVTVTMSATTGPDGGGSQTGTATLTATGNQTEIVVNIDVSPDGPDVEQPTHVHAGTCGDNLREVVYSLTSVVDGASTTVIDATLDSLQTGDFSINVHKSGEEIGVYVSCGVIPAPAAVPTTGGSPGTDSGLPTLTYALLVLGALTVVGGATTIALERRTR